MKSRTFILCSIFLLASTRAFACGPFIFYPEEYIMPRIYDPNDKPKIRSQASALMDDWKTLTGSPSVSVGDIEMVVNGYSVEEIRKIPNTVQPSNSFAAWIMKQKRSDIVDYLVIAKDCEQARAMHNSRWYYPSKDDGVEMTLEDIREISMEMARQGGQLASRYVLQAIRAMNTLGDYDGMETFWKEMDSSVSDGIIREMCMGYIPRAEFEHGFSEKAIEEYSRAGDISSVAFCLRRIGEDYNWLDLLEYVAKYCPNNDYAPKTLQDWFTWQVNDGYGWNSTWQKRMTEQVIEREYADRICKMSDNAVANKDCQNPAMWLYCKALALDLSGRPYEAQKVNRMAASAVGTDFIWNSIRIMEIYLDAKTATYDKAYETRLLKDLQWLDGMIVNNLTDEIRRLTIEEGWHLYSNQSYYYWNDMLKKIVLGEICPRMIERGNEVLAIRLANMADNRLLGLVDTYDTYYGYENRGMNLLTMEEYRKRTDLFNQYDYRNSLFELLNHEVKIASITQYVTAIEKPANAIESFLDSRGYTEKAYFLDVAGTRYIREHQYSKAVQVLERVPAAYQYRLNTALYMDRDPFQLALNERGVIYPDYKLNFAKEMAECDRVINGNFGPDEKGRAMIKKGIGTRAAASFAWPLTEYSYSDASYWFKTDNYKEADVIAQSLIRKGLAQIKDREVKAQELLNLQLRLEVVQNYKGTLASNEILRHCDEYQDYR